MVFIPRDKAEREMVELVNKLKTQNIDLSNTQEEPTLPSVWVILEDNELHTSMLGRPGIRTYRTKALGEVYLRKVLRIEAMYRERSPGYKPREYRLVEYIPKNRCR
jgi:hypothetical protein